MYDDINYIIERFGSFLKKDNVKLEFQGFLRGGRYSDLFFIIAIVEQSTGKRFAIKVNHGKLIEKESIYEQYGEYDTMWLAMQDLLYIQRRREEEGYTVVDSLFDLHKKLTPTEQELLDYVEGLLEVMI